MNRPALRFPISDSRFPALIFGLALALPALAQEPALALTARPHRTLPAFAEEPRQVAFSPDSKMLATSSVDHTVKLWRLPDGQLAQTLVHPEGITSIAFSPDGRSLVSGSYDRLVRIWSLADGALTHTLRGHGGTVWTVAISPDGRTVASGGRFFAILRGMPATSGPWTFRRTDSKSRAGASTRR